MRDGVVVVVDLFFFDRTTTRPRRRMTCGDVFIQLTTTARGLKFEVG